MIARDHFAERSAVKRSSIQTLPEFDAIIEGIASCMVEMTGTDPMGRMLGVGENNTSALALAAAYATPPQRQRRWWFRSEVRESWNLMLGSTTFASLPSSSEVNRQNSNSGSLLASRLNSWIKCRA